MAGKVVMLNEGVSGKGSVAGLGGVQLRHGRGGGGHGDLVCRPDRADHGRYDNRACDLGSGCRDLRLPNGSAHGGPLGSRRGRALLGSLLWALAFCLLLVNVSSAAVPAITSVTPVTIIKGAGPVNLVIQGVDFVSGDTVAFWGDTAVQTVVYSATTLLAVVPAESLFGEFGELSLQGDGGQSSLYPMLIVASSSAQLEPVLYVAAGLLAALAFILGVGQRWS